MRTQASQSPGPDVIAVRVDSEGSFTAEYSDGTTSLPTNTLEHAVIRRQRARGIAIRTFLRRT